MFDLLQNPMNNFPLYIFSNHFFPNSSFFKLSINFCFKLSVFLLSKYCTYVFPTSLFFRNIAHQTRTIIAHRFQKTHGHSFRLTWKYKIISHLNRVLSILFPSTNPINFYSIIPLWLFSQSSLDILLHTQCPLQ